MATPLRRFLAVNAISQADVARGIGRTTAYVSQLVNGTTGATKETIDALLAFFGERLGRSVTYEELFAAEPTPADKATA